MLGNPNLPTRETASFHTHVSSQLVGISHIGEDGYGGVEDAGSDVENDAEFSISRASIKIFGSH